MVLQFLGSTPWRQQGSDLDEVWDQEVRQLMQHSAPLSPSLRSSCNPLCGPSPPLQDILAEGCICACPAQYVAHSSH